MIRLRMVLAGCAVAVCGCSATPAGSVPPPSPAGRGSFTAANWLIVAPGGGGSPVTPARLDVLAGSARTVLRVPGPPGRGLTVYPWAVNGQYVAAVTGMPGQAWNSKPADGVAYAFRPGGAYHLLGRAIAVYPASQPGRFWIRTATFGGHAHRAKPQHCTVRQIWVTGHHYAMPVTAPCTRWIIAAVPGGFVSVPTTTANAARWPEAAQMSPETPVQLWDPESGKVVRTYRIDPGRIYGASGQYLVWQPRSAMGQPVSSVEITNLATGRTRRITLPRAAGDVPWRLPVLAPRGPYLAWTEISKATWRRFNVEQPSGAGGMPDLAGPGRLKIIALATGRAVLDRAMTITWSDAVDWSPDNRYLFLSSGITNLNVVPTWSATAPIRNARLPSHDYQPDTQLFFVTLRTTSR